jgi:capsular exopolysaccharide synthesis family protein
MQDHTFRTGEEVTSILQLPVLSSIPALSASSGKKGVSYVTSLLAKSGRQLDSTFITHNEVPRFAVESYRRLRTTLMLSLPATGTKRILITSSTIGEGKTTTTLNLAFSLASNGQRVLVIDGDLRNPQIHNILHIPNDRGLTTILNAPTAIPAAECIRVHKSSKVSVLTSGPEAHNAPELLGSLRMRELVNSLQGSYDFILIDSPPVHACIDAVLLALIADGVVVAVRAGVSERVIVWRTCELLYSSGARILGILLNRVPLGDDPGWHYASYYYYKDQGSSQNKATGAGA